MRFPEKLILTGLGIGLTLGILPAENRPFRGYSREVVMQRSIPLSFADFVETSYRIPRSQLVLERGSYLIIAPDNLIQYLSSLVAFKRSQGFKVLVRSLSAAGPGAQAIKNTILQELQADPMLEYVLLIGDVDGIAAIPSFYYGPENDVTDQRYTHLLGDDLIPDIFIGRFSVKSVVELGVLIAKTIHYHREPLDNGGGWLERGLVVAGNYSNTPPIPVTPVWTSQWVREELLEQGYEQVDTVYYPPVQQGAPLIQAAINNGVGIVNYRGWGDANGWHYPEFHVSDVAGLNNGWMTPVFLSFVCNSNDFANTIDPCLGEALIRSGSPAVPRGGCAVIGPSDLHTSTRFNNVINAYMLDAMLDRGVTELAPAMLAGQLGLFTEFPQEDGPGEGQEFYMHVYNLLGDPALNMHLTTPQVFSLQAEPITLAEGLVQVRVLDDQSHSVEGAVIAVLQGDSLLGRGLSGPEGRFNTQIQALPGGSVEIYANRRGFVQEQLTSIVIPGDQELIVTEVVYRDAGGNVLEQAGIGQILTVTPRLKNRGSGTVAAGSGTLNTDSDLQIMVDQFTYPEIPPGQEVTAGSPARVRITGYRPGAGSLLTVSLETGDQSRLLVPVARPQLRFDPLQIDLQSGAAFSGDLRVINDSPVAYTGVEVLIRSLTDSLRVTDSLSMTGLLPAWGSWQETAAFAGWTGRVAVGSRLSLEITLRQDTVVIWSAQQDLEVIPAASSDPLAPCWYGYWAYDDTDSGYEQAPDFEWIELDPAYGGSGGTEYKLDDDDHVNVELPFPFTYFGRSFTSLTINSNGWISFIPSTIDYFWNYSIPMALGPAAQVAAFWDDLEVVGSDSIRVYTRHEQPAGMFLIQWSRALNGYDETTAETFAIRLYDSLLTATPSGDGVIEIHYLEIADVDLTKNYSTVGIESPDQNEGLQYLFNNRYAPGAAPLENGRAIRFTTASPSHYVPALGLAPAVIPDEFSLSRPWPNPFNPRTTFSISVPQRGWTVIRVFDLLGREVDTIVNRVLEPGQHTFVWSGRTETGRPAGSGTYFLVAVMEGKTAVRKVVLLK